MHVIRNEMLLPIIFQLNICLLLLLLLFACPPHLCSHQCVNPAASTERKQSKILTVAGTLVCPRVIVILHAFDIRYRILVMQMVWQMG